MSEKDCRLVDFENNRLEIDDLVKAIINSDSNSMNSILNNAVTYIRSDKLEESKDHNEGSFNRGYRKGLYDFANSIAVELSSINSVEQHMRSAFKNRIARNVFVEIANGANGKSRTELMNTLRLDKLSITNTTSMLEKNHLIDIRMDKRSGVMYSVSLRAFQFMQTQRYFDLLNESIKNEHILKAISQLKSAQVGVFGIGV